jgi:hypothetical protein
MFLHLNFSIISHCDICIILASFEIVASDKFALSDSGIYRELWLVQGELLPVACRLMPVDLYL